MPTQAGLEERRAYSAELALEVEQLQRSSEESQQHAQEASASQRQVRAFRLECSSSAAWALDARSLYAPHGTGPSLRIASTIVLAPRPTRLIVPPHPIARCLAPLVPNLVIAHFATSTLPAPRPDSMRPPRVLPSPQASARAEVAEVELRRDRAAYSSHAEVAEGKHRMLATRLESALRELQDSLAERDRMGAMLEEALSRCTGSLVAKQVRMVMYARAALCCSCMRALRARHTASSSTKLFAPRRPTHHRRWL